MNEQIRAIAEQATDKWMGGEFFDKEKFALLIVRECAKNFAEEPDKPFYGRHVAHQIKQHFGIE